MERGTSPPPSKRRKLSTPSSPLSAPGSPSLNDSATDLSTVRIFSWNVNGIAPFIPAAAPITSYFQRLPAKRSSSSASRTSPLSPPPSRPPPASLRAFLRRHNWPHVLLLQEIKIASKDTKMPRALEAALNTPQGPHDPGPSYTLHMTLPRDRYNAKGFGGKLYGVASIVRSDFQAAHVARVRDVDWDVEGRVSIIETKGFSSPSVSSSSSTKQHSNLAILNIYAVNGTDAAYRSPVDGVQTGTRHDRKLAFHTLLRDECIALERRDFHVLVIGDLNVARGPIDGHPNLRTWPSQHCVNRADFNAKFFAAPDEPGALVVDGYTVAPGPNDPSPSVPETPSSDGANDPPPPAPDKPTSFRGVDVFRAQHGARRQYTYYPRSRAWGESCDRVDLVLASRSLWREGGVLGAGILDTAAERGPSDHVPLWVVVRGCGEGNGSSQEGMNGGEGGGR